MGGANRANYFLLNFIINFYYKFLPTIIIVTAERVYSIKLKYILIKYNELNKFAVFASYLFLFRASPINSEFQSAKKVLLKIECV